MRASERSTVLALTVLGAALSTLIALAAPPVSAVPGRPALHDGSVAPARAAAADAGKACQLTGSGPEAWPGYDSRLYQSANQPLRASMIFVDFPDHPAVDSNPQQTFGPSLVAFEKEWLEENSSGRTSLDVNYDTKWLTMSKPAAAYGLGDRDVTYDEQTAYLKEAAHLADDEGFDFEGRHLLYVVAAPTGGAIPDSPAWIGGSNGAFTVDDGATAIKWGATTGDDVRVTARSFGAHVLAHETGHTFGLPDLYTFGSADPEVFNRYVGAWDLMGDIGPGLDTLTWHKRKLGWLTSSQWRCVGYEDSQTQVVSPSAIRGGMKMVVTPVSQSVAYVAEVRTPVGLDAAMCDQNGGVLIYRVDANTVTGSGPIRVQSAHPGRDTGDSSECGPLSSALYDVGQEFSAQGVSIQVRDKTAGGYQIKVTNRVLPPGTVRCPKGTSATVTCKHRSGGGLIMTGTGRAERFVGTNKADVISGKGGADRINGRGGADRINGGAGADRINGQGGADRINGQGGADRINGGPGRDRIKGGPGHDRINCGGGRDRATGTRGDHVRKNCERVTK